jgi:hypothetical protein
MNDRANSPLAVTPVDVDVLAALTAMQAQLEHLTRAVEAQQVTLDTLVAERRQ